MADVPNEKLSEETAAEKFSKWLNEGQALANAVGLYVGITLKPLPAAQPNREQETR